MIVELFGAPSAGKTALASALARRLIREQRHTELVLSPRHAEQPIVPAEAWAGMGGHARRRGHHLVESLLELDLQTSLQQVSIIDEVSRQMQRQGWPIIRVASLDRSGLCAAVERIVQAITPPVADPRTPTTSIAGCAATASRAAPTTPPPA